MSLNAETIDIQVPSATFICPDCRAELKRGYGALKCIACGRIFSVSEGIFHLLPSHLSKEKIAEINLYKCPDGIEQKAVKELLSNPIKLWRYIPHEIFRFEREILEKTPIQGRVLELGSGLGWGSVLIKRRNPSIESYVSDISLEALEGAKKLAETLGVKVRFFIQCDAERLPFSDNYFDFVLSWAVIHHFPDPRRMFSEVSRVLKVGGQYIAGAEPCFSHWAIRMLEGVMGRIILSNEIFAYSRKRAEEYGIMENNYSFDEWTGMLKDAGFNNFRIDLNHLWSRNMSIMRLIYETISQLIPDSLVARHLATSIVISAVK